ncbi:DNA polymerase III subunit gamma/tau [Metamycoplasma buccale]|uniref:DNA polymerase III subunit gamma/tau n=1 Tax=Metamycoplasma buccale TaxID=55602 RepID=UPI00398EE905
MEEKYLALYRHYRPTKFDEVKGQEHIIRTLLNIIKMQKIGHAYLFCGPHGTGKTSVAKIFANTINCSHSDDIFNPCEKCIESIDRNLDIIEIDAASNTGIDDIRELREKIKHMPTQSKYKIYIIDEVHMLSKGAFNALLKTLEEPPKHAIFILATTDPQKIPLTILSRVQRFNFKHIDTKTILNHLKYVYDKENIYYDKEALELIANLGNGSLRDSLSIADQVSIFAGDSSVKLIDVEKLFGITNIKNIIELINLANNHEIKELLTITSNLFENGVDVEKLIIQMIDLLKDYLIYSKTNAEDLLKVANPTQLKLLTISLDKSYLFINELISILKEVKFSDLPIQSLELGFIKLASLKAYDEDFINTIESPKISEKQIVENDFLEVDNDLSKNSNSSKNNKNNLNSMFDLASIANQNVKTSNLDINELLEKTQEMVLEEKTQEIDKNSLTSSIISDVSNTNDDFEINTEYLDSPEILNFDILIDCLVTNQLQKIDKKNGKDITDYKTIDKLSYAMIQTKLVDSNYQNARDILDGLEILQSSKDFVLFTSPIDLKILTLNKNAYKKDIVEAGNLIFNRYVHLFGVTKTQMDEAKKYWKNNIEELKNRVPKSLEDLSKKYDKKSKEMSSWAKETFGEIFEIKGD